MECSDRRVFWLGVGIAFLVPIMMAGLAAVLIAQAGPHEVVLAGVPREDLGPLEAFPEGRGTIPKGEAIKLAVERLPGGANNARVREVALGKYAEDYLSDPLRGKLVWVVNFGNPDDLGSGFVGGPVDRDRSCDWSVHYDYVFVVIDGETGEFMSAAERAHFDPSRPPRSPEFQVTEEEQERCERFFEEQRELAESLTP